MIINELIKLMKDININEISKNENSQKVLNTEKFLNFNKRQKGKGIKILTPKQMLQRLPNALGQVKAGNTPENLLNEVKKIVCSLHQEKKITKNVITT